MAEIEWAEWGKAAFDKAKKENKLLFLEIFGTWCHWCHVAEETTYRDRDVIKLLNEKFVPIKVDTDKRPDINDRYNLGGWPTTAILTQEGEIVSGGTYIAPARLFELLVKALEFYNGDRERFERFLNENRRKERKIAPEKAVKLEKEKSGLIEQKIVQAFDAEYGGFGGMPKFPMTEQAAFMLLRHRITGNSKLLEIVEKTLEAQKGIFDNEEGGFYRYAVQRSWTSPHYEKMMETNSGLLANNLEAFQITGNRKYRETAEETISYINENLFGGKEKHFFASQDADEEYYALDIVKRKQQKKPKVDKTLYTNTNCLAISAFLKGAAVLEKQVLGEQAISALETTMEKCLGKEKGISHYWQEKPKLFGQLADNALLANALLDAFEYTQEKGFLRKAQKQAEWVVREFWDEKQKALADSLETGEEYGYLKNKSSPLKENCLMAECLAKLSIATEKQEYVKKARIILNSFKGELERYGVFAAPYGIALEKTMNPIRISVSGSRQLHNEAMKLYEPRAIRLLEEGREEKISVCIGTKCLKPVKTVQELEKQLEKEENHKH